MPDLLFVFAVLTLLLTPGPTNTLLMVGGAALGFRTSLHLLLGELAGYLVVVVPLATVASALLETHPALAIWLRIAAAIWVLVLAVRLWRISARQATGDREVASVSISQVFLTTVLNPKASIIGLVIMPRGTFLEIAPALAVLAALVVGAGTSFLLLGALVGRASPLSSRMIYRVAAIFLAIFSAGLAGSASGLI
jgi:threonine/homoserine/homoserine lactone efflux protein